MCVPNAKCPTAVGRVNLSFVAGYDGTVLPCLPTCLCVCVCVCVCVCALYYLRGLMAFNVLAALATGGLGVSVAALATGGRSCDGCTIYEG